MAELLNSFTFLDAKPGFFVFVFWGSLTLVSLTLAAFLYLAWKHTLYLYMRYRSQRLANDWSKIFSRIREGQEPDSLPGVSRSDRYYLLELWLENRRHANYEAAGILDKLADRINLETTILNLLLPDTLNIFPRKIWLQSQAIAAVEYIDSQRTRNAITEIADSDNQFLAVQACACMAKIMADGYERKIITILFRYPGEVPEIFTRLSQAGGSEVLHLMEPFLNRLPHITIMNFISLAEQSGDRSLVPVLEERLRDSQNDEETAALIRTIGRLGAEAQRTIILPYLNHASTNVRIQAAKAIGRIGLPEDRHSLIHLLSDTNWWVRYRSARALVKLCDFEDEMIQAVQNNLQDRFAREIIIHAQEELEWHQV